MIGALGHENCAFVGGAVRDSLLGRDVSDIDMATSLLPEDVQFRLEQKGVRVVPTGLKHGTVTAVGKPYSLEITTLRADVETDGRHATVAFVDDWREDAMRRDFTINAIYLKPDGEIFDPVGGLSDLQARHVCFIGDPHKRIREDALRILRFYRFSGRFSDTVDTEAHTACVENRALLRGLSVERVRDELIKILASQGSESVLPYMDAGGLFREVFGAGVDVSRLVNLYQGRADFMRLADPLSKLWLMLRTTYDMTSMSKKLKLSGAQKRQLARLDGCARMFCEFDSRYAKDRHRRVREVCYKAGVQCVSDLLIFFADVEKLPEHLAIVEAWDNPVFPVKGRDLLDLGFRPGSEMGQSLKQMEERWIASDFALDKQSLLTQT